MLSQNGYKAKDFSLIATYTIPNTKIRVSLRKGDVSVVLLWVAAQFHKRVEPLRQSDTGGYNPRSVIGGVSLSNHASGTAIDVRWRDHPIGKVNTFNAEQRKEIRAILKACDGIVRWGGDYKGRKDEMHFEIVASPSAVARVADKIRKGTIGKAVATPAPKDPSNDYPLTAAQVRKLQSELNRVFPAYKDTPLRVDGKPGLKTTNAIKEFQRRSGLTPDGIPGPKTRAELKTHGIKI